MATKQSTAKANDKRLTKDDDPKTTIGVSMRRSLIQAVRARSVAEDLNFSAMVARLVKVGLSSTSTTEKRA